MPPPEISSVARQRVESLLRAHLRNPGEPSSQEVRGLVYSLEADREELETELHRLAECRACIEDARNRFSELYEFAPLGYLLIGNSGRIEYLNRTFTDLVGLERESLEGMPLVDLVAVDDRDAFSAHLLTCRRDNRKVSVELRLRVGTGASLPVQLHTVPAHTSGDGGKPSGYRVAVVDIADLMREREERERLQQRLQHLQKLRSLMTMAGGVAHDFNNILTVIQGFAGMVQSELPEDGPGREHCREILRACKRGSDLSGQMLAFAGQWDRTIKRVGPAEFVRGMQSVIADAVSGRAEVEYVLSEDVSLIEIDVARMRQAVLSLVTNAVESIGYETSGKIRVSATQTRLEPEHAQAMEWGDQLQTGDCVVFEVSDNGCGMDEVTRRQMFDPFFSTRFAGRGLGLCTVLGIVRAHNGGLDVTSSPSEGTAVQLYVPVAPVEEPPRDGLPVSGEVKPQARCVVLVADDEPLILEIINRGLSRRGFTVLTARDGEDAVRAFENNRSTIDAVILDMTMPRMNGREAFRQIKALKAGVPVVLTSGYTEAEAVGAFEDKGLAGFIPKPFTVEDVARKLRAVVGRRAR